MSANKLFNLSSQDLEFLKGYKLDQSALSFGRPKNVIEFLVFFSPIFFAIIILGMSFIFQNIKGFIYLGFLLGITYFREILYYMSGANKFSSQNNVCTMVKYSDYDNGGYNIFISAFSAFYLCTPMVFYNELNYMALGGLLVYILTICGVLTNSKCIDGSMAIINVIFGGIAAIMIVTLMYAGGSGKYLFFNELSSNREVCSMPKQQTFRCSVYKNGELVGSSTT
jgi:hypothetical protein